MSYTPLVDSCAFSIGSLVGQYKVGTVNGPELINRVEQEFAKLRKVEADNTALRNEIARLNGQTNWECKCGGTDCKGQRENEKLRQRIAELEQKASALNGWLSGKVSYCERDEVFFRNEGDYANALIQLTRKDAFRTVEGLIQRLTNESKGK